jgi:hypothetical protein
LRRVHGLYLDANNLSTWWNHPWQSRIALDCAACAGP